MNKWLELFLGLILLVVAVLVWGYSHTWGNFWNFGNAAWEVLKGGIMWLVIMIGLLLVVLGITEL